MSEPRTIHAYAAPGAGKPVEPFDFEAPALGPTDVEIKVSHCGICHSDVHLNDGDWGPFSQYPQVSGHELVGTVENVGSSVKHLEIGMRVGVGWQKDSCRECKHCRGGEENACASNTPTCAGGNRGGFADYWRGPAGFALPIPEGLDSATAAPMLCGGITVYSPIVEWTKPTDKVGIVGIGGLGHMALQFARARGCEVYAFSTSPDKEEEAKSMGAHHFVNSKDPEAMKAVANELDCIIVTITASVDWQPYIEALAMKGVLCFVGAVPADIKISCFGALIPKQIRLVGSMIGGRTRIAEMLQFAALHDIKAVVEVVPMADAEAALQKVRDNKARYRMVLQA